MPENHDDRGINYLAVCDATKGGDSEDTGKVAEGIRAVIRGELEEFIRLSMSFRGRSSLVLHAGNRAIRMSGSGPIRVVASHEEITALKLTEKAL